MIVLQIFFVVAIILGLLHALFFVIQDRLLFKPVTEYERVPKVFNTFNLTVEAGVKLTGWHLPAEGGPSKGNVIFFHGNRGNMGDRVETYEHIAEYGYDVWTIDYRGYGQSTGKPSEEGILNDLRSFDKFLQERLGKDAYQDRIIFGRSLGGAIAIKYVELFPPKKLIIEATFLSVPKMAKALYPFLFFIDGLIKHKFESYKSIAHLKMDKLIIHSEEDDYIPFWKGRKLFEIAPEPKKFLSIKGSHAMGWYETGDYYLQEFRAFIDKPIPSNA